MIQPNRLQSALARQPATQRPLNPVLPAKTPTAPQAGGRGDFAVGQGSTTPGQLTTQFGGGQGPTNVGMTRFNNGMGQAGQQLQNLAGMGQSNQLTYDPSKATTGLGGVANWLNQQGQNTVGQQAEYNATLQSNPYSGFASGPGVPQNWQNQYFSGQANNFGNQMQGQINQMQGFDPTSGLTSYQNPYQNQIQQLMGQMGQGQGGGTGQLQDFVNQFNPQTGGMTVPGVNAPNLGGTSTLDRLVGSQTNVQTPGSGVGGDYLRNLLQTGQSGTPGVSTTLPVDPNSVSTARQQQLAGYQSLLNQPGMSEEQMKTQYEATMNPVQNQLQQALKGQMASLSDRGMGRNSQAVNELMGNFNTSLGQAGTQAMSDIMGRNFETSNANRLAALSGMGGSAGQGLDALTNQGQLGLTAQGQQNQQQLGLGNLAGNLMGNETQSQQWQQEQQFAQDNAKAGLDLAKYQTAGGFQMDQYKADLQNSVSMGKLTQDEAQRLADNQLRTTQLGQNQQGMGQDQQSQLAQLLLGAGSQDQNAWNSQQGNLLQARGLQSGNQNQLLNALTGLYGQNQQDYLQYLYGPSYNADQQLKQIAASKPKSGGVGGFLGGLVGTGASALTGGLGAGLANQIWGK